MGRPQQRRGTLWGFWLVLGLVPLASIAVSLANPVEYEQAASWAQRQMGDWGLWAPVLLVAAQILQVIFAPISHYLVGAIGGFLFGPLWGGALNWVGRVIGHTLAFLIAGRWFRPLVERFVRKDALRQYDRIVGGEKSGGRTQSVALFLLYFLPFFPDDELSYLAGLSNMRFRAFMVANVLGHIGGAFSLAYAGSGVSLSDPLFWIFSVTALAGFPLLWKVWAARVTQTEREGES